MTDLVQHLLRIPVADAASTGSLAAQGIEQVIDRTWPWSIWISLVTVVLLFAFFAVLYFTERGRAGRQLRLSLVMLRVAAILIVIWMLAGWRIQRFKSDLPELIIALDDSASMQTADGTAASSSNSNRQTRWELAQQVIGNAYRPGSMSITNRYRPKIYSLSEEVKQVSIGEDDALRALANATPTGQQSRLGDGLIQILQRQSGRPTAALILISDGIVTGGAPLSEAIAAARRLAIPIYSVATGQQLPQPELALTDLLADDAVYLGDRVNVQVTVTASDIARHRATIQMRDMQSGKVVDSAQVELSATESSAATQLSFVPTSAGNCLVKLEVVAAPGEKNLENNTIERMIEVRDQSLRVLLVQKSPSFEYRFLKTLLERTAEGSQGQQRAFQVDVVLQDADASHVAQDATALRLVPGDREIIRSYDAIVIGQVDLGLIASSTQQLIVDHVTTGGCGCIFICHPDFDVSGLAGWPLANLLPIDVSAGAGSLWRFDGQPKHWQPTRLGLAALPLQLSESPSSDELWRTLPGPQWYYRTAGLKPGSQVLALAVGSTASGLQPANATQAAWPRNSTGIKFTTVQTPRGLASGAASDGTADALLISQFVGAGRVLLQTTDETYRWIGYRGNDLMHERYWIQMLRWLSRGKLNAQDQTELAVEPRRAQTGEPIQFSVRLSQESLAALGSEPCEVVIERIGGESKTVAVPRTQNATAEYRVNESSLGPGSYRARLNRPADDKVAAVNFSVTAPPGEQANLRSDWQSLKALAEQTHGKFYAAHQTEDLFGSLPKGNPVRRGTLPSLPLWNSMWVAIAFVVLLTLEWIIRRLANML